MIRIPICGKQEEDIAQHAHRIVRLKDGLIESDTQNKNILTVSKAIPVDIGRQ